MLRILEDLLYFFLVKIEEFFQAIMFPHRRGLGHIVFGMD